ncbi:polysaccharide biosynthesis protein [Aminipila terrae]
MIFKRCRNFRLSGIISTGYGGSFQNPLGNIIGDAGMGYYQTAYPIYVFLLVFSTNGAPAAISKMTSERIAIGRSDEAHRVFKLSFILMLALGIVASSIFFFGAEPIVKALGNPGAYYAMISIAPALLFVPIMAVFRGYFQGMQEMAPTATSQLMEQAVRVTIGLALAIMLVPKGIEYAAAGATVGTSIGPIAGVLVLLIIYLYKKSKLPLKNETQDTTKESAGSILKTLAAIAIPITIGVSILPIMNIADVIIVMRRLQSVGFSAGEANALYGQLTGMVGPVINLPMALALSMALSMVPAIAAAASIKDAAFLKLNVRLGLRTAMIIGVPCSFGLMALAEPIMKLLYPLQAASAVSSAGCLFFLSIGIVFLCIAQTMAGTLQGLGKPGIAVWGLAAGFVVKCISTFILTGITDLNVEGAAIGSTLGYITIGMINFAAVKKMTGITFDLKLSVWKPLISGLVMFVLVLCAYKGLAGFIGNSMSTVVAIGIGAVAYGMVLLKIKAIEENEIGMLPKGEALVKLLRKCKLV